MVTRTEFANELRAAGLDDMLAWALRDQDIPDAGEDWEWEGLDHERAE
jgi:hypothetical protein